MCAGVCVLMCVYIYICIYICSIGVDYKSTCVSVETKFMESSPLLNRALCLVKSNTFKRDLLNI